MSATMAYLRRDFLIWTSYRLAALWQVLGIVMVGALVYFAGTALGDRSEIIPEQDGSYVAFVLVGLAFTDVLLQGLGPLPQAIHDHQRAGTLEPMMLTPISDMSLLTSFWLFKFLLSLIRMMSLMAFGFFALGFWHSADPLTVAVVLIPAELTFLAIGALSAAFVVLVKEGDPVRFAYTGIMTILGGAFFPVEALPPVLQALSALIPLTHALDGIRAGLDGASVADVLPQIIILSVMAVIMLPAGLYSFSWAIRRAKEEGSLGEY